MKITIIEKREWGGEGQYEGRSGFGYTGFTEGGGPIKFTSSFEHEVFPNNTSFNPKQCEEITLQTKIWEDLESGKNRIKYSEAGSDFTN